MAQKEWQCADCGAPKLNMMTEYPCATCGETEIEPWEERKTNPFDH